MPDRPQPATHSARADGLESTEPAPAAAGIASTPRLLCVRAQEPSWIALTLGLGAAGCGPPRLVWVATAREALARIREEPFDCVLIDVPAGGIGGGENGPFELSRALRTAGCEEPIVLIGRLFMDAEWTQACSHDCDVFVGARGWDSPALGAVVQRAVRRGELVRESRRLAAAHRNRLLRERDESEQLLAQQRQIIAELEALPNPLSDDSSEPAARLPRPAQPSNAPRPISDSLAPFTQGYAGLLRSYVLMGSGSLAAEIGEMADRLVAARLNPPEALQLHLHCVEGLVRGLGNRSSRHVLARADLLVVEMMTRLAHHSQRVAAATESRPGQAARRSPLHDVTGNGGVDLLHES